MKHFFLAETTYVVKMYFKLKDYWGEMRRNVFMFRAETCCLKSSVFEEVEVLPRYQCSGQIFANGFSKIEVKFISH